jgi:peptidoglycan hydrolase CwlO-like protein
MNALTALIVCLVVVSASVLYGTFITRRYRAGLARAQARFDKQRHALTENLDRAKRQIGQLQDDLSAARREIDRLTHDAAEPVVPPPSAAAIAAAKQELARVLADEMPTRRAPAHGFADTLPSLMFAEEAGLLIR